MKKRYASMKLTIETFDESDIVTASPSSYDGTGYIPDSWWHV